jgi:hypothetical protein
MCHKIGEINAGTLKNTEPATGSQGGGVAASSHSSQITPER